jgi:hypothetical protein
MFVLLVYMLTVPQGISALHFCICCFAVPHQQLLNAVGNTQHFPLVIYVFCKIELWACCVNPLIDDLPCDLSILTYCNTIYSSWMIDLCAICSTLMTPSYHFTHGDLAWPPITLVLPTTWGCHWAFCSRNWFFLARALPLCLLFQFLSFVLLFSLSDLFCCVPAMYSPCLSIFL